MKKKKTSIDLLEAAVEDLKKELDRGGDCYEAVGMGQAREAAEILLAAFERQVEVLREYEVVG